VVPATKLEAVMPRRAVRLQREREAVLDTQDAG
jgi:hypothetical protein